MISVCSVLCGDMEDYVKVFTDSIKNTSKYVTEVIFIQVDASNRRPIRQWKSGNIDFRILGYPLLKEIRGCCSPEWAMMVCGHACGLHEAIEQAGNDYIWLSDPDVFFFNAVDDLYLRLMKQYELSIIGVSHFNSLRQSYCYFPCVTNCLLRKSWLPDRNWLLGDLWVRTGMTTRENPECVVECPGKYLMPSPIPSHTMRFPCPDGMFDVGCNLWLWNEEQHGRWLAFYLEQWNKDFETNFGFTELVYPLNYNTQSYMTNFDLQVDLGVCDLLYHRTRGSHEPGTSFRSLYVSLRN